MTSEIKNKCIHKDCITDCKRKRPVKTSDGFCMDYNNGKVKFKVTKKCLSGKESQ